MHEITIETHFDSAHRLSNYKGACENIHGHRWLVQVTIESKDLHPESDMLVDFKILKQAVNNVVDRLDHATILKDCEANKELIKTFKDLNFCLILIEKEPTAEYISKWIYDEIKKGFHYEGLELKNVRVYESPKAWADYNE